MKTTIKQNVTNSYLARLEIEKRYQHYLTGLTDTQLMDRYVATSILDCKYRPGEIDYLIPAKRSIPRNHNVLLAAKRQRDMCVEASQSRVAQLVTGERE